MVQVHPGQRFIIMRKKQRPQTKGVIDVIKDIEKVYGPYLIEQLESTNYGRKQVIVHYKDGSRRTFLLSRHLMEQHLGRRLLPDETVDHKDRDKTNDDISNLQILSRSEHTKKDIKRIKKVEITCIFCGNKAQKNARDLDRGAKLGKAGPFCSKKCVGRYGAEVQNGRMQKLNCGRVQVKREYYFKD